MKLYKVIEIRHLTESTFVIRFERNNFEFQTGQFVMMGLRGAVEMREYSIYSGENDGFLEVLVREVKDGNVSGKLKKLKKGDIIDVDGPFGFFRFQPFSFVSQNFLFVATGTGISPFHSFIRTYPEVKYQLLHGVRFASEAYDHRDFNKKNITLCTTGDKKGDYHGRVTQLLLEMNINPETNCFLCGNSEMIYEAFDVLTGKGIKVSNIYSEVYF